MSLLEREKKVPCAISSEQHGWGDRPDSLPGPPGQGWRCGPGELSQPTENQSWNNNPGLLDLKKNYGIS